MFYPDLRSLDDVDALPMPEFNLRVECIADRIRWERGIPAHIPAEATQPITKRKLIDVLAELQSKRNAEGDKTDAR